MKDFVIMKLTLSMFALATLASCAPTQAALAAQEASCTQYGIIQAIGQSPQQITLQVIVIGQPGQRKTIVLPESSAANYRLGQRICVDPAPTK